MRTRALVALVVGAVVAGDGAARPAAQQPQFRAGIDLVQIDVVALDESGHPVRGLTAADFTLLDRQKAQRISTFKEVTLSGPGAASTSSPPGSAIPGVKDDVVSNRDPPADQAGRCCFSMTSIRSVSDPDRVKDIAHKVANALGPQSAIAVLFTSGHHSTEFTRDPADISAAIDAFVGAAPGRRPSPGSDNPRTPFKGDPLAPAPPSQRGGTSVISSRTWPCRTRSTTRRACCLVRRAAARRSSDARRTSATTSPGCSKSAVQRARLLQTSDAISGRKSGASRHHALRVRSAWRRVRPGRAARVRAGSARSARTGPLCRRPHPGA